jgi:hypothetical protein
MRGDEVAATMDAVQREWPRAGFVIGGRAVASRARSRPGVDVCDRVSEAVEAVDAMVQRADQN